jgi:hypothetical protein
MITALEQRNNFLLELIHKAITNGAASNVNITGDSVGLNKEVTQLQSLTVLQNILSAMTEVNETIWIDSTNTFFLRRLVYDEATGATLITYTLADGSIYVPILPISPASNNKDVELSQIEYVVVNNGTGYTIGQFVTQVRFYNTSVIPATLLNTIFINDNSNTVITPLISDLIPRTEYYRSKIDRIKGSANYNRVLTYNNPAVIGSNVTNIVHTGTTAIGNETVTESFTYVSVATIGSNVTDITYS